jgi:PAS domain S-box-containing protein
MSQLAWIGDEKGWLFWYNKRWFDYTGTTLEQMAGWGWKSVHHPDHIERVVSKFSRHVETGETWEDTFPLRGKDGTYRWFLSRAQPIRDDVGKVVLWFGTNTDITAQRDAEEALREASRRKDVFLAMLAHELRNPLAPVRTAVHILRSIGSPEPKAMRARDIIERQVAHMARLIDDLLDVSRITRGKLELRKERCDLAHIVAQTIEDYRTNIESGGLTLTVSVPREPLWVEGDPTRLVQMVGNVLHNASRFTEKGDRVAVRVETDLSSHAAIVTVEDTGVGMDPALLSRLFDPFSQGDQGIDRSKGGLGLGLALTKGLVELHGGSVTAHSEGLGRGSTFTLRLPLAEAEAPKAEEHAEPTRAVRLRVVIIEDNEDAAETLSEWLSLAGHEVKVAHDGRAGIDLVREARPEVVISDIGLPGGADGYAVARALRADPSVGSAFMIALSGYAQEEDLRRSRAAGFDEHLAKPPDLRQLEAMLARGRRRG